MVIPNPNKNKPLSKDTIKIIKQLIKHKRLDN